jgi:hypothetical protein
VRAHRRIDRQRQVGINLAQEIHGAGVAAEQQRVLAAPAQAGLVGQGHFHHRRRVGKNPEAERAGFGLHPLRQLLQPAAQDLVVVAAAGIDGHHRGARIGQARLLALAPIASIAARQVIHARHDYPAGAGHQFRRPGALAAMGCHIIHFTVVAGSQPGFKAGLAGRQVGVGDAHVGKAEFASPGLDGGGQRRQVDSRNMFHDKYPFPSQAAILKDAAF